MDIKIISTIPEDCVENKSIQLTDSMMNLYYQCNGKETTLNSINLKKKKLQNTVIKLNVMNEELDKTLHKITSKEKILKQENMKLKSELFNKLKFNRN